MTSETTWTVIGLALGVLLLFICGVAVLLDHRAQRRAVEEWQARNKVTCHVCGDAAVLHLPTHLHLAHGERPLAPEDREDWA